MTYHTKYRPTDWDQVIGQKATVAALSEIVREKRCQAVILTGPSGTGKTTLARIAASKLDCELIEIDAASHTGVDAMREIISATATRSVLGGGRAIVIDEAHRLSKQAWDASLKSVEEPMGDTFWFFCTTEPDKVPATIRTRCAILQLKEVSVQLLKGLVANVAWEEGLSCPKEYHDLCANMAKGSCRQALVNLATIQGAESLEVARELLNLAPAAPEAIDLARLLSKSTFSFDEACKMLQGLKGENPESVRIVVFQYLQAVALSSRQVWAFTVLGEFEKPAVEQNYLGDILLRVARLDYRRNRK